MDPVKHKEFYVAINEGPSGDSTAAMLEAVVKIPVTPIALQAGSTISLQRWKLTELSCPAIKDVFESFRRVERPGPTRRAVDQFYIHPLVYEFYFRDVWNETRITIHGMEQPLAKWVERVRELLRPCLAAEAGAT